MNTKTRDKAGFKQYHVDGAWVFNVTGFDGTTSGQAGFCTVERFDGSHDYSVPIDARDRILIGGKRYTRRHWNH
jgi:hypothetical protein